MEQYPPEQVAVPQQSVEEAQALPRPPHEVLQDLELAPVQYGAELQHCEVDAQAVPAHVGAVHCE